MSHIWVMSHIFHPVNESCLTYDPVMIQDGSRHTYFICETWLISPVPFPICMWRDSFICATWLIHKCDVTHSYVTRLIHVCDMTHSNMWRDSLTCVTRIIHMCHVTLLHVWHVTSFIFTWSFSLSFSPLSFLSLSFDSFFFSPFSPLSPFSAFSPFPESMSLPPSVSMSLPPSCCSVLQCVASVSFVFFFVSFFCVAGCCRVLQCVAVCCRVLQCVC